MPTNEERREVAERLREKHGERQRTFEPQSMSIQAMNRLDDLLECLPKKRDMFLDLADLIEPEPERTTTRNGKFKTRYGNRVPLCEFCGYSIGDKRYNYCPNCGCKVVE